LGALSVVPPVKAPKLGEAIYISPVLDPQTIPQAQGTTPGEKFLQLQKKSEKTLTGAHLLANFPKRARFHPQNLQAMKCFALFLWAQ